jgi:hypothetical protein
VLTVDSLGPVWAVFTRAHSLEVIHLVVCWRRSCQHIVIAAPVAVVIKACVVSALLQASVVLAVVLAWEVFSLLRLVVLASAAEIGVLVRLASARVWTKKHDEMLVSSKRDGRDALTLFPYLQNLKSGAYAAPARAARPSIQAEAKANESFILLT